MRKYIEHLVDQIAKVDWKVQVHLPDRVRWVRQGVESDEEEILQGICDEVNKQEKVFFWVTVLESFKRTM